MNRKKHLQNLLLLRHAKASPYGVTPGDHGRHLSSTGKEQCTRTTELLQHAGLFPDLALVSTALRTRQTWDGLQFNLPKDHVHLLEQLYLADAGQIENEIHLYSANADTMAVIGHNPGIALLAWKFLETGSDHDDEAAIAVRQAYKTGYAAHFRWNDGKPVLKQLFDPRIS